MGREIRIMPQSFQIRDIISYSMVKPLTIIIFGGLIASLMTVLRKMVPGSTIAQDFALAIRWTRKILLY